MRQTTNRRQIIGGAISGVALLVLGTRPVGATDCMTAACADAADRRRGSGTPRRTAPPPTRTRPAPTRTVPRVTYTLWNASDQPIRFRLPSGRDYRLAPGRRGRYHNTYRGDPLTIHVYNTGRSYRLKSGHHKFFWYRPENRIGLDLNYDTD